MEVDNFGITEYLSDLSVIECTLKHLYSDFIVHEISEIDKQVVQLRNMNAPESTVINEPVQSKPDDIDNDVIEKLEQLADCDGRNAETVQIVVGHLNKCQRTAIHTWIRQQFTERLTSTTKLVANQQVIDVTRSGKGDRIKPDTFGIAGTKDRRAITSQRVSVYRVGGERLAALNQRLIGIWLGDFTYNKERIALGQLWGNRFSIVLRNIINVTEDDVRIAIDKWSNRGFVNYYGTQRFGTCITVPTSSVGRCIVQGKWQEAVELILAPRPTPGRIDRAIAEWNRSKNAIKAFSLLPPSQRFSCIEGRLLAELKRQQTGAKQQSYNYRNVLIALPRNTRSLYVHAYQSLLWNQVASMKIRQHALSRRQQSGADENETNGIRKDCDDAINNMTIPLPSSSMTFSDDNMDVAEMYNKLLAQDGVTIDSFVSLEREFAVGGDSRELVIRPIDVKWRLVRYNDVSTKLQLSDNDLLLNTDNDKSIGETLDGRYQGLCIEFSLPAGAYATIALRELTRVDMSKAHQSMRSSEAYAAATIDSGGDSVTIIDEMENAESIDDVILIEDCD